MSEVVLKSKVQIAEVGDVIRSLDFAGNLDHYMIGQVVEVNGVFIKCKAISRVWEGKSEKCKVEFFETVQNGAHMFDNRYPGRITVL